MAEHDEKSLIEEVNEFMDLIERGKQLLGEQKQDDFGDVCDSQK